MGRPNNTVRSFGSWLKQRRGALDLTQEELALAIGCSIEMLRKMESNVRRPSKQLAERLAEPLAIAREDCAALVRFARQGQLDDDRISFLTEGEKTALHTIPNNLPAQTTPFVGRGAELAALQNLVKDQNTRLTTIVAQGGMGKTRLALELAKQFAAEHLPAARFPNGIFFVQLAPLISVDHFVPAIGDAVGYRFQQHGREPYQQLKEFFQAQAALLVLDNFEHLLDAVPLADEILAAAPGIKILATSRERLDLEGETLFRIEGMDYPVGQSSDDALQYSAVQLFLQGISHAQPSYDLSPEALPLVAHICQMVEGMPLGIILAAAWADLLSLKEIANEISCSLDFLETEISYVPERQRSIRAVFDSSWNLLQDAERATLMKLSVCHGGFTRGAAQALAGATLRSLAALVNKSLLRRDLMSGRYDIHELFRQYAEHRLEMDNRLEQARQAHSSYYLDVLAQQESNLKGRGQLDSLDEIEADLENVRRAWQYATRQKQVGAIGQALDSFYLFCQMRSRFQEADEFFGLVVEHFAPQQGEIAGIVWSRASVRFWTIHNTDGTARTAIEASLKTAQNTADQAEIAFCLRALGQVAKNVHDYPLALRLLQESLTQYRTLNLGYEVAQTLSLLANCYRLSGQSADEIQCFQESFELSRALGDKIGAAVAQYDLGATSLLAANYSVAEQAIREATNRLSEIGDWEEASWSKTGLGFLMLLRGNLAEARLLAKQSLQIAEDINSSKTKGFALVLQAAVASLEERYIESRDLCEDSRHVSSYVFVSMNAAWWQANAACGLQDYGMAKQYINVVLKFAAAISSPAVMLWCLPVMSILTAYSGRKEKAVERLALAFSHPASAIGWLEKWPLLSRFRVNLQAELDAQSYAAAWERGKALGLRTVVDELLAGTNNV